jgi:hypothetical protein
VSDESVIRIQFEDAGGDRPPAPERDPGHPPDARPLPPPQSSAPEPAAPWHVPAADQSDPFAQPGPPSSAGGAADRLAGAVDRNTEEMRRQADERRRDAAAPSGAMPPAPPPAEPFATTPSGALLFPHYGDPAERERRARDLARAVSATGQRYEVEEPYDYPALNDTLTDEYGRIASERARATPPPEPPPPPPAPTPARPAMMPPEPPPQPPAPPPASSGMMPPQLPPTPAAPLSLTPEEAKQLRARYGLTPEQLAGYVGTAADTAMPPQPPPGPTLESVLAQGDERLRSTLPGLGQAALGAGEGPERVAADLLDVARAYREMRGNLEAAGASAGDAARDLDAFFRGIAEEAARLRDVADRAGDAAAAEAFRRDMAAGGRAPPPPPPGGGMPPQPPPYDVPPPPTPPEPEDERAAEVRRRKGLRRQRNEYLNDAYGPADVASLADPDEDLAYQQRRRLKELGHRQNVLEDAGLVPEATALPADDDVVGRHLHAARERAKRQNELEEAGFGGESVALPADGSQTAGQDIGAAAAGAFAGAGLGIPPGAVNAGMKAISGGEVVSGDVIGMVVQAVAKTIQDLKTTVGNMEAVPGFAFRGDAATLDPGSFGRMAHQQLEDPNLNMWTMGLPKAVSGVIDSLEKMNKGLLETADRLAPFSGALSAAQAQAGVRQLTGDIKRADYLGEDLAGLVSANSRYQQTAQDALAELVKPLIPELTKLVGDGAVFINDARPLLVLLGKFLGVSVDVIIKALEAMVYFASLGKLDMEKERLAQEAKDAKEQNEFLDQFFHLPNL